MKCEVFRKKLLDYIYNTLSAGEMMAMKDHLKTCPECRKIYNEEISIDDAIEKFVVPEDIKFESIADNVMSKIDKNYYNKTVKRRAQIFVKRNITNIIYAASFAAAVIISLVFLKPMVLKEYNNICASRGNISANIQSVINKKSNQTYALKLSSENKMLNNQLKNLKTMQNSALPWVVDYTSSSKICIRNYPAVLEVQSGNLTNCTNMIDLKNIDATHMQGNIVSYFNYSPDGNYVLINNGGIVNTKPDYSLYLYSFINKKMITIDKAKYGYSSKWSANSRYFAYITGNEATIFDAQTLKKNNIYFKDAAEDFAVSEDGDIVIMTTSKTSTDYYLLKNNTNYSLEKINISSFINPGEEKDIKNLLYFNSQYVAYYSEGRIMRYDIQKSQAQTLKDIGMDYKCTESNFRYSVFTNGISTIVTDNKSKFYKYDSESMPYNGVYMSFSPDLKKCLITKQNQSYILTSDGKSIKPNEIEGFSGNYAMNKNAWIDNNTIVRVQSASKLSNIKLMTVYVPD